MLEWVGTLITWPYASGGRSRRESPKAGTTVLPIIAEYGGDVIMTHFVLFANMIQNG